MGQDSLQAGARHAVATGDTGPVMDAARGIARQMVGGAEFDGIRAVYERLLHEHSNQAGMCASPSHATSRWGPCDVYRLAAANLELLELLDGSRFSPDWPGPVKERNW